MTAQPSYFQSYGPGDVPAAPIPRMRADQWQALVHELSRRNCQLLSARVLLKAPRLNEEQAAALLAGDLDDLQAECQRTSLAQMSRPAHV